jgi:dimeric dUTPase (all-alpha-NTP-PPase superfamily)
MNLQKLFELQRQLDEHIEKEHPRKPGEDRLAKKILALMVELGELANEARFFKYWSHDQEPRTAVLTWPYGAGGPPVYRNRVLEEFVDGLHFILSIGLEIDFKRKPIDIIKSHDVITQFNEMFRLVSAFWRIYAETGVIKRLRFI